MADAAVKAKTMVQMTMPGTCPTHARTDITVRDVETVVDEPKDRGGTNLGPCYVCVRTFEVDGERVLRRVCIEGPVFDLQEAVGW